jgi:predicted acetyltransferase/catechol 2,3-dioxygenase-like lactoylglutathione lyase family enzyme/RimJ/RimL family protein N-acetyltransferase
MNPAHEKAVFSWLEEPHVQQFWDNSKAHKDDILNFIDGRKVPSCYADGKYLYWIAKEENQPFALIMTIKETIGDDIDEVKQGNLSRIGSTFGLDYMIGDKHFIGKGYGAKTLLAFVEFFKSKVDAKADTFFIDPACDNPRATHVYLKAGFNHVADFVISGDVSGKGKLHHLLVKRFNPQVTLIEAKRQDYPLIKNMSCYYAYDLARACNHIAEKWTLVENGFYDCCDVKRYFDDTTRKVYLIKVYDEIAGFILLNKACFSTASNWNLAEFFILSKFQRTGIGQIASHILFDKHHGLWEVAVIPENRQALCFWQQSITQYTKDKFKKDKINVDFDINQPKRIIFSFKSLEKVKDEPIHITPQISGMNHITLAVKDIERSFEFYTKILGLKPLVKWHEGACFLAGEFWFCVNVETNASANNDKTHYAFSVSIDTFDLLSQKIIDYGSIIYKNNDSPGKSLYFLDPDGHRLEIHVGNCNQRINVKQSNPGNWKNVEWFL